MADVYERLREHLDTLPGGFPKTEDGVELRILRRLFTPEEAELAQHLRWKFEPASVIAKRAGMTEASESSWYAVPFEISCGPCDRVQCKEHCPMRATSDCRLFFK